MRCVTQSIHTESDVVVIHLADCMHKKNRTSVIRMWLAFGLKTGPARGVTVSVADLVLFMSRLRKKCK